MAVKLNDLIKIYSGSLTVETCEDLIEIYEANKDHHERIENDRRPNFTQLNFTDIHNDDKEYRSIHRSLVSVVKKHKNEYYKFVDSRCFPDSHNMEFFRIKKSFVETNINNVCAIFNLVSCNIQSFFEFIFFFFLSPCFILTHRVKKAHSA